MNEKNVKIVKGCLSYMEMTTRSDENLTADELLARSRITPTMVLSPLRVLWLDTEQSQQSTQDILVNLIIPLCRGDTTEAFDETFFAYNLRGLGFKKRLELTKLAIGSIRPDLVIVDGVKDLMTDINDVVR